MKKRISTRSLTLYITLLMYGYKKLNTDNNNIYTLKVRNSMFSPIVQIHKHKAKYCHWGISTSTPYTKIINTSFDDIIIYFDNYYYMNIDSLIS